MTNVYHGTQPLAAGDLGLATASVDEHRPRGS